MNGALLMGKHNGPFTPIYTGHQCELCKGFWATVQVDEGVIPQGVFCLATEGCRGVVVTLLPTEEPIPDWVPVLIEWFKPLNNARFYKESLINDHLDRAGLLMRPTPNAPDWVKARVGYYARLKPI